MIVRKAVPTDLHVIVALWQEMMVFHQAVDAYFTPSESAEEAYRTYAASNIAAEEKLVLVCVDNGDVIGFIQAEIRDYPPVYPVLKYAQISDIAVTERKRGMGAGKLLLTRALQWAKQRGVTRVQCQVAVNNRISQGFWKKNGFRGVTETCVLEF
jgi:ribosomal protein S18 acetylase RimI-like enzyme